MQHMRFGFLKLALAASMLIGVNVAVTPAQAAVVTFSFTGATQQSDFQVNPPIAISGTVQGIFTFNNSTGAVSAFTSNIFNPGPSLVYQTQLAGGASAVTVYNNTPVSGGLFRDRWELSAAVEHPSNTVVNGFLPIRFDIQLDQVNPSPSLFSSNAVQNPPLIPPSLGLTGTKWRVIFDNGASLVTVSGLVSTMTPVPLPPAVLLFGAGLAALIGLGARSWKKDEVKV